MKIGNVIEIPAEYAWAVLATMLGFTTWLTTLAVDVARAKDDIRDQVSTLESIDRRLSRIEGRLGIPDSHNK
jgi:hypothetical protein